MPATPIVFLAGVQDVRWALEAIRAGAEDVFPEADLSVDLLSRTIRYSFVCDHAGRMTVESVPDGGTRFFPNLPLDKE